MHIDKDDVGPKVAAARKYPVQLCVSRRRSGADLKTRAQV